MLEPFGLSSSQSKLYEILVKRGSQTAKDLASAVDIPLTRCYSYLSDMENIGIIIKSNSRPALFTGINPKDAVSILLDLKRDELKALEQEAVHVEDQLNSFANLRNLDSNFFRIMVGPNLREHQLNLIAEAKESLLIVLKLREEHFVSRTQDFSNFFNRLKSLKFTGVELKILLEVQSKIVEKQLTDFLSYHSMYTNIAEIRIFNQIYTMFYIIDNKKVLVKIVDPLSGNYDFVSIFLWENDLATSFIDRFDALWDKASLVQY